MITESCDFDFKHRCVKQKMKITKYITSLQRYVHKYEQSANCPLKFLSSIKTAQLPQIHITLHTSRLFMTESLNKESLMKSLIGSKRMGRKFQLFIPSSELLQSHRQTVVRCCYNQCLQFGRCLVEGYSQTIPIEYSITPMILRISFYIHHLCHHFYSRHEVNHHLYNGCQKVFFSF